MKRIIIGLVGVLAIGVATVFAADIPKGLLDSKPDQAVLITLSDYYAKNPPKNPGINSETVFSSPRSMVTIRTAVKGTSVGAHYHSTADEIVYIVGGSGELLINGKWLAVKAGDLHVNPRGNVHDTRALAEDLRFISIFTPQLPAGGDANMIK